MLLHNEKVDKPCLVSLVDVQCTQSPWTYGYPMNSPLVKTAKTEGSQSAFLFELPLSKERDSFLPSPTSSSLTRMMVSEHGVN